MRKAKNHNIPKALVNSFTPRYGMLLCVLAAGIWMSCSEEARPKTVPLVTTGEISGIGFDAATVAGEVVSDGNQTVAERGIVAGIQAQPTIADTKVLAGSGTGVFTASLAGLQPVTTYHVRAFATNAQGTSYGQDKTFTTGAALATLTTTSGSSITLTSASAGGNITSDGGAPITARGVVYGVSQNPTLADFKTADGSGTGAFTSSIAELKPSTVYYVRAYATNTAGTAYGAQVMVSTLAGLTDVDGNAYASVVIGTQTWMKENLKVGKYRNGDPIPVVSESAAWAALTTGAICYYNNDVSYNAIYGKLYNGYAAGDLRGLCPVGWHLPSDAEWTTLTSYLGGTDVAGGKMKSTGTDFWAAPNSLATNESGFTALPSGNRDYPGPFVSVGTYTYWWTSTVNEPYTLDRGLAYNHGYVFGFTNTNRGVGYPVRCVKD